MKADSLKISKVFSTGGDIHYVLPHFQREYSWEKQNWDTLLEDAMAIHDEMRLTSDESAAAQELEHFLGSLVVINDGARNGTVPAFKLVDGQQRLTTISLLLCALGRIASDDRPGLAKKINKLLINADEEGDIYFKILPTVKYGDRDAYTAIMRGEPVPPTESRIPVAYDYLLGHLRQKVATGTIDPEKFFLVLTNSFQVVFIDLNQNESPYQIFESLNAKGKPLSQADLVRNYIAMKLPASDQEQVFKKYWSRIEQLLQEKRTVGKSRLGELTAFLRHYLAMKTSVLCSEDHVYARFRDRIERDFDSPTAFESEIAALARFADYYNRLLRPESEPDVHIREAMKRLNTMEVATAYPFLLAVYDAVSAGRLSDADFREVLGVLENYIIRRYLAGEPTNFLNKMFPTLWQQIETEPSIESIARALAARRYPSDARIRQALLTKALYDRGSAMRERTTLILDSINKHLSKGTGGYTVLDGSATIEHIMPQTASPQWQAELGPTWVEVHRDMLHILGNLTLVTGEWNSILSNETFDVKRPLLARHALRLNSEYFGRDIPVWNRDAIIERTTHLADAVLAIWPTFDAGSNNAESGLDTEESRQESANFHTGCMNRVALFLNTPLEKRSMVTYESPNATYRIVCAASKRYERKEEFSYWFAFHTSQIGWLASSAKPYVAYGCGAAERTILIPFDVFQNLLENMSMTSEEKRSYWHVYIYEKGNRFWLAQPKLGNRLDITQYVVSVPNVDTIIVASEPPARL